MNDMANKLSAYQTSQIGSYANSLIANNVSDTTSLINTMLSQYLMGANLGQTTLGNAFQSNQLVNNFNQWQYAQQLRQSQQDPQWLQMYMKWQDLASRNADIAGKVLGMSGMG